MPEIYPNTRKILSWAEEDRPREKLLLKGRTALSDAELIAILIGSGTADLTAVDVAKEIMHSVDNNINLLARQSLKDLMKIKGIGEAKAITIMAALELGRRRKDSFQDRKVKINQSSVVYDEMKPYLQDKLLEEFWIILLNKACEAIRILQVSIGGLGGTIADTRVIFKLAIENLAHSIILVHNHPSGQLYPSPQDISLTNDIVKAGKVMDIPIMDHLIYTDNGYYSFRDADKLPV
ncbi:hypothetical protein DYBT9275_02937 [Dyadobacter sp. CECT 9275]|uniref:MPN domain-containing protein n=1 Tax=Dyadobacter helix TaxID=2822344 RepID=A0A916JF49_9BACT|nr:DNA repair protein RadC [Dyadobacter sp. CECT 9275]CAG5002650.1 hypothetical protein DYBT9275_02937 [Dyadobacter sp. CECT 9275]